MVREYWCGQHCRTIAAWRTSNKLGILQHNCSTSTISQCHGRAAGTCQGVRCYSHLTPWKLGISKTSSRLSLGHSSQRWQDCCAHQLSCKGICKVPLSWASYTMCVRGGGAYCDLQQGCGSAIVSLTRRRPCALCGPFSHILKSYMLLLCNHDMVPSWWGISFFTHRKPHCFALAYI